MYRFISTGTLEELVYARQVYKQQMGNIGQHATAERRYFDGVVGDKARVGKLFGLDNLFSANFDQRLLEELIDRSSMAEHYALGKFQLHPSSATGGSNAHGAGADGSPAGEEDTGVQSLGAELIAEQGDQGTEQEATSTEPSRPPGLVSVEAILSNCGVEYRHENAQVAASNEAETLLSEHAKSAYLTRVAGQAPGQGATMKGPAGRSQPATNAQPQSQPQPSSGRAVQAEDEATVREIARW